MTPKRMKIYIASSVKNLAIVQLLTFILKNDGFEVLDWTAQPSTQKALKEMSWLSPEARRQIFDTYNDSAFKFSKHACQSADLVIYLGQSGQDAAAEVGIAHAAGIKVFGLASPLEAPGLILNGCVTRWFENILDLLAAIELKSHLAPFMSKNFGNGHGQGRTDVNANEDGQKQK